MKMWSVDFENDVQLYIEAATAKEARAKGRELAKTDKGNFPGGPSKIFSVEKMFG